MYNVINQAQFTVAQFSILELTEMRTALGAEQYPVKDTRVAKIVDSFIDGPLLQPLEVTTYEGLNFLSGGRNRTAALAIEYADDLSKLVTVLQYKATTSEELIARMVSSNGSRSMSASETKELNTSAKFGFDALTVESIVAKAYTATETQAVDMLTLALAIQLDEAYGCGKNTGLVVSRSLMTSLKKMKVSIEHPAKVDDDGTLLTVATVEKRTLLSYTLSMGIERTHELLDSIVCSVDYAAVTPMELPGKVYNEALLTGLDMVESNVSATVVGSVASYYSTVTRPATWQRSAAKWVKVMVPVLKVYLSESLELHIN
jgi:hypothetical protein